MVLVDRRLLRCLVAVYVIVFVFLAVFIPMVQSTVNEAAKRADREQFRNRGKSDRERIMLMQERIDRLEQSQQKAKE